ncbi:GFA family protein [Pinirhizobacter soli]|uniref:GFA family protein n=1 Tax=Pinirhizobacter soli TaxID=2786953 RepID=UPI002029BE11|nr:GFA family protein [Pinirhizobacter soli]
MATSTHTGSCHCGAVRYQAELDLESGSGKCNCSICSKVRLWGMIVKPDQFKLLGGEDALSDYQFGTRSMHWLFCRFCGVHAFGKGNLAELGGEFFSVNLASLDDMSPEALAAISVRVADGRHDNWMESPAVTSYL